MGSLLDGRGLDPEAVLGVLREGGPVLVVLAAVSVAALALILVKLWQFHSCRIGDRDFIEPAIAAWQQGRSEDALRWLARERNPIARLLEIAIAPPEDVGRERCQDEIERVARAQLSALRGSFRGLELIAALSPLLGLLGTVLGMIEAFGEMRAAAGRVDPALLAGGISEALLTTAAGIMVAIPASAALAWLEGKVDRLQHDMEDAVTRVLARRPSAATEAPAEETAAPAVETAMVPPAVKPAPFWVRRTARGAD